MRLSLRFREAVFPLLVAVLLAIMPGCGGGGTAPPPAISVSLAPAGTTTIDQGQTVNFTATVTNDSSSKGVTWSVSGTACTGAACGTLTNTTATTAKYNAPTPVSSNLTVSVKATSVADTSKSASSTVVVTPAPSITITSLSDGTAGTAYSATLQVSGGAGTLHWSVSSGTLPPGLSLNSSTGVISGTPTSTGSSTFTVQVTDSGSPALSAQKELSITINNPLTVTTTSLPDGTVGIAYSQTLGASGGATPYSWSVTSGTLPAGLSLTASTGAIAGTPTTAGASTFTVTATDSSTPTAQTASQQLSITIAASGGTAVNISSPIRNIQPGQSVTLNASVQNDIGNQGVTWTLTSSPNGVSCSPTCGTLSNETTSSVTYTAPGSLPSAPSNVPTITAKSVADNTKSASDIFAVTSFACGTGNEQALSGPYALILSGYDSDGYLSVGSSVTPDGNGRFTDSYVYAMGGKFGSGLGDAHEIDLNASTYSLGSDNRGCATLWLPHPNYPTDPRGAALTIRFSLKADGTQGRIIEFDPPTSDAYIASGGIWKQDMSVVSDPILNRINGDYAFSFSGVDSASSRWGIVGAFSSNSGCNFTNGEVDINDAGATDHRTGLGGYCTGVWPTNGRFQPVLQSLQSPSLPNNLIPMCFLISGSEAACVTGSTNSEVQFTGMMRKQTGTFTNSSLNAAAAFHMSGLSGSGPDSNVNIGFFTGDGSGTTAIAIYEDDAGTLTSQSISCTYSVASNGRTPLGGAQCASGSPILYLTSPNTGLLLGTDSSIAFGQFEPQATGPFNNALVSGTFFMGTAAVISLSMEPGVGSVTLDGAGNISSGISDSTSTTSQDANFPFTDTYSVNSDGTFTIGSSGTTVVGIVISGNKLVKIDHETSTEPSIMVIEK